MGTATYKVVIHDGGWGVMHDGETNGPYATKEGHLRSRGGRGQSGGSRGGIPLKSLRPVVARPVNAHNVRPIWRRREPNG
jgi:hypothetical protein